jgi:hypothetical protein
MMKASGTKIRKLGLFVCLVTCSLRPWDQTISSFSHCSTIAIWTPENPALLAIPTPRTEDFKWPQTSIAPLKRDANLCPSASRCRCWDYAKPDEKYNDFSRCKSGTPDAYLVLKIAMFCKLEMVQTLTMQDGYVARHKRRHKMQILCFGLRLLSP